MKQSEYRKLSAVELTTGVRDGLFSNKEVFEAFRLAAEADKSGDLPLNSLISVNDSPQFSDGPLAGLPMLYKDSINTSELPTTVGSIVFENAPAAEDADVVRVLRGFGAVTAAKANLSEWANFRGHSSISGWSAAGGQCRNPHDRLRSPGGSSAGSAVAVAAGIVPVSIGSETDGSVICPASVSGVFGFKPSRGVISTKGMAPISPSQDTVGIFARSVQDIELIFSQFSTPENFSGSAFFDLGSTSVGLLATGYSGYSVKGDALLSKFIDRLSSSINFIDGADRKAETVLDVNGEDEVNLLRYEMYHALPVYLKSRRVSGLASMEDLIEANRSNAEAELSLFGQEHLEESVAVSKMSNDEFEALRERHIGGMRRKIDSVLEKSGANFILTLSMGPSWLIDDVNGDVISGSGYSPAAVAGYPSLNIPIGKVAGLPVGAVIYGPMGSDWKLLGLAKAIVDVAGLRVEARAE